MNLTLFQRRLSDHFEQLASLRRVREERSGSSSPVYFIEHQLTRGEVSDLVELVSHRLKGHQISEQSWRQYSLTLIVAAVEVGYHYRGAGNDFWPRLSIALKRSEISIGERAALKEIFIGAASKYHGALPHSTPWSEAFHIIAWPITHAVAPIEFHRYLAQLLSMLQHNISSAGDEALSELLRKSAKNSGSRLRSFIHNDALIAPLAKALLRE